MRMICRLLKILLCFCIAATSFVGFTAVAEESVVVDKVFGKEDTAETLLSGWEIPEECYFSEYGLTSNLFGKNIFYKREMEGKYQFTCSFKLLFRCQPRVFFNYVDEKNYCFAELTPTQNAVRIITVVDEIRYTEAEKILSNENFGYDTVYQLKMLVNGGSGYSLDLALDDREITVFDNIYLEHTQTKGKAGFYNGDNPLQLMSFKLVDMGAADYVIPEKNGADDDKTDEDKAQDQQDGNQNENRDPSDVPGDNETDETVDSYALDYLTSLKVFDGSDEAAFAITPAEYKSVFGKLKLYTDAEGETVTPDQAVRDIIRALGYDCMVDYKNTYYQQAAKLSLFDGIDFTGNVLKKYQLAKLIYNALDVPMMLMTTIDQDGTHYRISPDDDLLSNVLNLDTAYGILQDDGVYSLYGESRVAKNAVQVGGVVYKNEYDFKIDYVGHYVKVYYKNDGAEKEVVFLSKQNEDADIIIDAENFVSYRNYVISYSGKNGKMKQLTFGKNVPVIKNGQLLTSFDQSDFVMSNGEVKATKDENGKISAVIIKSYTDLVVNKKDDADSVVYNMFAEYYTDRIMNSLDFSDMDYVKVIGADGKEIKPEEIEENDILTVNKGSNYIVAYVSKTRQSKFKIQKISQSNGDTVVSDGTYDYKLNRSYYHCSYASDLKLGAEMNLWINHFGDIVWAKKCESADLQYGILADVAVLGAFGTSVKVAIFKEDSQKKIYALNDKLVFVNRQGEKSTVKAENLPALLNGFHEMVAFKANDNDEITYLELPLEKWKNGHTSNLVKLVDRSVSSAYPYRSNTYAFEQSYFLNNNTEFFCAKPDSAASLDSYGRLAGSYGDLLIRDTSYKFDAYSKGDSNLCDFVILYDYYDETQKFPKGGQRVAIVTDVYQTIDLTGEIYYQIVLNDGSNYRCDDIAQCMDLYTCGTDHPTYYTLQQGDMINYTFNPITQNIETIIIVYRSTVGVPNSDSKGYLLGGSDGDGTVKGSKPNPVGVAGGTYKVVEDGSSYTTGGKYKRYMIAWVYRKSAEGITVTTQNLEKEEYRKDENYLTETYHMSLNNFYRYNPYHCVYNPRDGRVEVMGKTTSLDDFKDFMTYGSDCSKVLIVVNGTEMTMQLIN